MYTTVPVLKLAYLLISILVTLYTFLWCMGIRPSTSDISSFFFNFVLIFTTMAYRNSRWNSRVKKVFYLFFVSVLSIPRNAFFVPREAFVVLEFVFAKPVYYVANFLLFTVIHKSNESQCTQLITSLRSVRIVLFNEPQRARPSAITTYANIRRWYHFFQFFVWFISFILERKRSIALSFGQTSIRQYGSSKRV